MRLLDGELSVVHDSSQADIKALYGIVNQALMRLQHGERLRQAGAVCVSLDEAIFVIHS